MRNNSHIHFWTSLKKSFFVLAPMADVTDVAFRTIIASCGRPDVFYTEFVSAHGLASSGRDRLILDLALTETDHPIVAQFFGTKPEHLFAAGKLANEMGFDGVDINMGCPDRGVMRQGAGVSLVKTPALAVELIHALRDGAGGLPVAVKTRLGLYKTSELETWIPRVLSANPDVLIIHGRTMKEMSKVPAHWDLIARVATMCHDVGVLCVGNGDVMSRAQGLELAAQSGVDGIMIGRGIFHNPWLFAKDETPSEVQSRTRMKLLLRHADLWTAQWDGIKSFDLMKRFYKVYVTGWSGASELRAKLMTAHDVYEVGKIIAESDSMAT